jgi:ATP-dependent DNA helicase RecG
MGGYGKPFGLNRRKDASSFTKSSYDYVRFRYDFRMDGLQDIVERMRLQRSDLPNVEAKLALGGLPESISHTLSAFANLPGGGLIVLGLDERAGFSPVRLPDPAGLKAALASKARQGLAPPVVLDIDDAVVDGVEVIVATVHEIDRSAKPCVVRRTGKAYTRSWDGDFELSELEVQGLLANRSVPRFDLQPVVGSERSDLDAAMVGDFINTARSSDSGLARLPDDETLLQKLGVIGDGGVPTVAGVLALGVYPQEFFPNFVIQAAVLPTAEDPSAVKARDVARFSGPISVMLDDATAWVARQSTHSIVTRGDGRVSDRFDLPVEAVRELLSNSLVHRDLAPWSSPRAIEMRIDASSLRLINPGGLFGVSVARLLTNHVTSARNQTLVRICQFVRTRDGRVVEALATGIPTILRATVGAGLPAPQFFDQAVSFTAVLSRNRRLLPIASIVAYRGLTPKRRAVIETLGNRSLSLAEIAAGVGLSEDATRRHLDILRNSGLVRIEGGRGRVSTTYSVVVD